MSLHDDFARLTPYEIAFPDDEALERLVADVREEASSRGVDPGRPGVFLTLGSVDDFARRLQDPREAGEAIHRYGALLFHAVHFVAAGRPLYLLGTAAARHLVEVAPEGQPLPPTGSGYLQLPQHLMWKGGAEGGPPESIDGIFWFASDAGELHVLPITGILPDQPGFSASPLPEAPLRDAAGWLEAGMREGDEDYASSIPGHELDGLYAVETAGEVLKLLARFFAYLQVAPGAGAEGRAEAAGGGPRPSTLPYTRVELVA
jgi:hypothetical protein